MTEEENISGPEAWEGLTALVPEAFRLADLIIHNAVRLRSEFIF